MKKLIYAALIAGALLAAVLPCRSAEASIAVSKIDTREKLKREVGQIFTSSARFYNIDEGVLRSICFAETGAWSLHRRITIVSPTGAVGICQILPSTARYHCGASTNLYVALQNIRCAAKILAWEKKYYCGNNLDCLAGSYLCGPTGYRHGCYTNREAWPGYRSRFHGALREYRAGQILKLQLIALRLDNPALILHLSLGGAV